MIVICKTCGREKAPIGRDVPAAVAPSFCHRSECEGYDDAPKPPKDWDSQSQTEPHQ